MSSSASKRQSILPRQHQSGPKAPVDFSSSILISDVASLSGLHTISIRSESVIHPRAKLDSTTGRINIGRRCIVSERCSIGATPLNSPRIELPEAVGLGDYVTVEVDAVVESGGTVVGEGCVIGSGSRVGSGAKLGKNCTLTPRSVVLPGEEVPEGTVIYANGTRRVDKRGVTEQQKKAQAREIEVLKRLISSNPAKFQ